MAVAVVGVCVLALPLPGALTATIVAVIMGVAVVYATLRLGFPSMHEELLQLVRRR